MLIIAQLQRWSMGNVEVFGYGVVVLDLQDVVNETIRML